MAQVGVITVKQPVTAEDIWTRHAIIHVLEDATISGMFYVAEIRDIDPMKMERRTLRVGRPTQALSHAIDYCNAHKMIIDQVVNHVGEDDEKQAPKKF